MNRRTPRILFLGTTLIAIAACGQSDAPELAELAPVRTSAGFTVAVATDTFVTATISADGTAAPRRESTLATKLMASVTDVLVVEGEMVRAGQVLVRLDARELVAKAEQVAAAIATAEATHAQAVVQAARMRALFVDGAAPKATLDAAETALAQTTAGLRAARASADELSAVSGYAEVRAPFAGRVTKRFVDRGAFAAPGAPLITVQDASTLRLTANITPDAASGLRPGQALTVSIEGRRAQATIEGIVPSSGNMYAVNALVQNAAGTFMAGSAATIMLPAAARRALTIPVDALDREGDLVGVMVRTGTGDVRRWIRVGERVADLIEVTSGLRAGELVVTRSAVGVN